MSGKLSLEQINQLANEPDSDQQPAEEPIQEENYGDQFENEPEEEFVHEEEQGDQYAGGFQEEDIQKQEGNDSNRTPINDMSEVQSQIQEENVVEEMPEDVSAQENTVSRFKNDQDLSLAKSEFIQSSNMDNLKIQSKLKDKSSKQFSKEIKGQEKDKAKTTGGKRQNNTIMEKQVKAKKPVAAKPKVQKDENKDDKKPKLSESEIKQKMKAVQQEKEIILKKKQQKQQKQEQIRRKEYEQAKKLEEERKEKNRKALEQQKKKQKAGSQAMIKSQMKIKQAEVKMPEKRTDFTYTNMVKQRKMMQKNIQKQIEQDNKNKLKKLLQKPQSQLKGQARKKAFLQQRKVMRQRQNKMRNEEVKEGDVLIIKQVKKQIIQARKFNKQKVEQINRAEKTIEDLAKKLKHKEQKYFDKYSGNTEQQNQALQYSNISQLTPIQKFIVYFPEAKTSQDIFRLIDANGDGILSSQQIKQKLVQFSLEPEVIAKVEQILDQNSDGTVSHEQFVFLIDRQLKKQKDYKQIMGTLELNDPLDLEAKIIDMQVKIKYINEQIDKQSRNKNSDTTQSKLDKLQKQVKKVEQKWRQEHEDRMENDRSLNTGANTTANLANQAMKLKNQKNIKKSFLDNLRNKVKNNLKNKNELLASRVEENLRLEQQIFRIQNQIQERQLRFLSLKKIQQNKKGYLQRQSQKMKEMQQAYKKTKQYKIAIADPSKKNQIAVERDEMRLLAAVLMIQRNYRRRKARGQFQKLKAAKVQS